MVSVRFEEILGQVQVFRFRRVFACSLLVLLPNFWWSDSPLIFFPLGTATGLLWQSSTFRSAGKTPRIKRFVKVLASSISTAQFGAIPNQFCVIKASRRRYIRMSQSKGNGGFFAVQSWGAYCGSLGFAIHLVSLKNELASVLHLCRESMLLYALRSLLFHSIFVANTSALPIVLGRLLAEGTREIQL